MEEFVCRLTSQHPTLSDKPCAERRIAIILGDDDDRGHAVILLGALSDAGYRVGDLPSDGVALAARLHAAPEESLSLADYAVYFANLPVAAQRSIVERRGAAERDPMFRPGRLDCGSFPIPAWCTGNIVLLHAAADIPPFAAEVPCLDPAPPHSFIAVCAWLADQFRADAVIDLRQASERAR